MEGYFQEPLSGPPNPIRADNRRDPSHPPGPGILTWLQEPLDFRRQGFSPCLSLLMSTFSLLISPPDALQPGFTESALSALPRGPTASLLEGICPVSPIVGMLDKTDSALYHRTLRYHVHLCTSLDQ